MNREHVDWEHMTNGARAAYRQLSELAREVGAGIDALSEVFRELREAEAEIDVTIRGVLPVNPGRRVDMVGVPTRRLGALHLICYVGRPEYTN